MIVDSSAVVAILKGEQDGPELAAAIVAARSVRMSAVNWLEIALVADSTTRPELHGRLDAFMQEVEITVVPFDAEMAVIARQANQRYGRHTPAKLNFGDCMAYALAKHSGQPLLYKGNDFAQTDITPARY